ncbi:hypothetical protein [Priestia aryabhattai]|uniref:hypothetical protein n=1 Tax=Priestia aryabhattai TaxID=412384 RepID=UPI0015F447F4|nr:hypothetical protein [Priestia aryabhattai]
MRKLLVIPLLSVVLLTACEGDKSSTVKNAEYVGSIKVSDQTIVQFKTAKGDLNLYWFDGGIPMKKGEKYKVKFVDDDESSWSTNRSLQDIEIMN